MWNYITKLIGGKLNMIRYFIVIYILFYSNIVFSGSENDYEVLTSSNTCQNCDFSSMDLSKLDFQHAQVSSSNFNNGILTKSFFQRANLSSSSFNNVTFIGGNFEAANFDNSVFEINSVTEPQLIAGSPAFRHQIKAIAHRSRLSTLQIEERPK